MYMLISSLNYFIIIIPILINIAFITLLERKILSFSQYRMGPSKVGIWGIFQPFSDAIKLFTNQIMAPFNSNYMMFFLSPCMALIFVLFIWVTIPLMSGFHSFMYSGIFILTILSFGVYPLLVSGWASNSKYAILGAIRAVAQTISYEISLALIFMTFMLYMNSFCIEYMFMVSNFVSIFILTPLMSVLWLISCLAETNRTPFDFSEGESELVSGFNIDYSSGMFAIIFIAEYASIYFLSFISMSILNKIIEFYISMMIIILYIFFWIWIRATLPRFRYDLLMNLAWKTILPITLGFLEVINLFSVIFF